MLPSVLLHVIDPPRPVDRAADNCPDFKRRGYRQPDQVNNITALVFFNPFNRCRAEETGIEWLAARRWIEAAAIEPHRVQLAARLDAKDCRLELLIVWVVVVQPLGHASPNSVRRSTQRPRSTLIPIVCELSVA